MTAHPVGLTGARFGRVSRYPGPPPDPPGHPAPGDLPPERLPAPTGARFARTPRRKTRPEPPPPGHQEPPLTDHEPPAPEPAHRPPVGPWRDRPAAAPSYPHGSDAGEPDRDAPSPTVRVRPYVHTGGRTRSQTPLPIEALVCAAPGVSAFRLHGTHRSVLELCRVPQSVAEVSAGLGVPLAVARVLVDDLLAEQMVTVQRGVDRAAPDLALMKRVLAGLHRL